MLKKLFDRYKLFAALAIVTAAGAFCLITAQELATREPPQITWYNKGVELYKQNDVEGANQAFDQSLAHYQRACKNTSFYARNFEHQPSLEAAALAYSHKGILYLMMQKPEQAVMSFKESLKLNDGDLHLRMEMPAEQAKRLHEQAYVTKYNLELLYRKNPSLAAREGKGRGRPGPGEKQAPGNDPGKMPGKGNRDDI